MDSDLPGLSFSSDNGSRAELGARQARAGARSTARLLELLGPLDPARHLTYLDGVQAALTGYDDAQVTQAVTRIARLGHASTNPVGLLVDRANAADPLYFPPPPPKTGDVGLVVEPPADLWSWPTEPSGSDPADDDPDALPDLDPDPTLASALAARAALDAVHQPVTREQLAVRQAELAAPGAASARDTGSAKPEDEEQAA
jgi:hypothetical protein